jgi:hypothetical protein
MKKISIETAVIFVGLVVLCGVVVISNAQKRRRIKQFTEQKTDFEHCISSQDVLDCQRPEILRNESQQCIQRLYRIGCCAYERTATGELDHFAICEAYSD